MYNKHGKRQHNCKHNLQRPKPEQKLRQRSEQQTGLGAYGLSRS
jgi:hypothetical protein